MESVRWVGCGEGGCGDNGTDRPEPTGAKALVRFVAGFVILLAMLLLPAGTVAYWEAWAYMAVLTALVVADVLVLLDYGLFILFLPTPVALGSWWAAIAALPLIAVLVARIRNEEQFLAKELNGTRSTCRPSGTA